MPALQTSNLVYPDLPVPEFGHATEIAEGLFWLRLPLPFPPEHINVYLIEDLKGWYILDTGLKNDTIQDIWHQVFANCLKGKPVIGVIATHMHPDHLGQAGFLCKYWQVPLYMSEKEFMHGRLLGQNASYGDHWQIRQFYSRNGLNEEETEEAINNAGGFSSLVEEVPRAFERLKDGQELNIGGRTWVIIMGNGHSPEHACLFCPQLDVLISGDQVLPTISPNVSVYAHEANANPLQDYLSSLNNFKPLPQETLVLPAHGEPFQGLHSRLDSLYQSSQKKLNRLLEGCEEARTVKELVPMVYLRELEGIVFRMAMGETLAHLNYLLNKQMVERTLTERDIYTYCRIDT